MQFDLRQENLVIQRYIIILKSLEMYSIKKSTANKYFSPIVRIQVVDAPRNSIVYESLGFDVHITFVVRLFSSSSLLSALKN